MNKRSGKMHSRRGVGLVEVIVALAIIVIVSASAVTLITSHVKLEASTVATVEAASIAENAVECYRYGGYADVEGLYSALEDVYSGMIENKGSGDGTEDFWVVTLNSRSYKVDLAVEGEKLTACVTPLSSGAAPVEISYAKPVGGAG